MPGWEVSLLVAFYYDNVSLSWDKAPLNLWAVCVWIFSESCTSGEHFPIHPLMGKAEQ